MSKTSQAAQRSFARKVLLATAAAFYPSTTFPALQMTGLTVITCASMCLYGIFHPYRQQIWNWSEAWCQIEILNHVGQGWLRWSQTLPPVATVATCTHCTPWICNLLQELGLLATAQLLIAMASAVPLGESCTDTLSFCKWGTICCGQFDETFGSFWLFPKFPLLQSVG